MELTDLEKTVILTLAKEGPLSGYDFHLGGQRRRGKREAIMSSGYWLKIKERLGPRGKNLIRPFKKRGRPHTPPYENKRQKQLYGLTLLGLLLAFFHGLSLEHVDKIVETFKDDLPLVFGKWDYFVKRGVENIAKKVLFATFDRIASNYMWLRTRANAIKKHGEDQVAKFEKTRWAKRLTDTFLLHDYAFLYKFIEKEDIVGSVHVLPSFDEISTLDAAIFADEELRLYTLTLYENRLYEHSIRDFPLKSALQSYLVATPTLVTEKLIAKVIEESMDVNPYNKILKAIHEEDYFIAAGFLCLLLEGYPFRNKFGATRTISDIIRDVLRTKRKTSHLENITLEALSAVYFFEPEPVKAGDEIFYPLKMREKRNKMLDDDEQKARAKSLAWAQIKLEPLQKRWHELAKAKVHEPTITIIL